jgi:hypothetical protein
MNSLWTYFKRCFSRLQNESKFSIVLYSFEFVLCLVLVLRQMIFILFSLIVREYFKFNNEHNFIH